MKNLFLLTYIILLTSTVCSAQQTKRNLIANSCFEEGLKHWYTSCHPDIKVNYYVDEDTPISGSASVLISTDQPGGNSHDAMLYTLFPVEKNAKYKISFKAMCSGNGQLKLEFCPDHDNYTPPVVETKPESFESEFDDNRLRGFVSVNTEVQEYTFTTQTLSNADWRYKLAFHFATATQYALYWIDDVKISRADDGDWDGNLYPSDDPGKTTFHQKGTSSDLIIPFCQNEEAAYKLAFTMQSNRKGELSDPMIPIYGNHYTIAFGNDPETQTVNCLFFQQVPQDQISSSRIERTGCWNLLFSNQQSDAGEFEANIGQINIKEQNLRLRDCEILNLISELPLGAKHQFKIGEFVVPTHADPSVIFRIEKGKGNATINQQGVLTGTAIGDVIIKVCNPEGDILKTIPLEITTPTSIEETPEEKIRLYPTIVSQGEDISVTGLSENSLISLYTINGQTIFSNRSNLHVLKTNILNPGIYIVRIVHSQKIFVQKLQIK